VPANRRLLLTLLFLPCLVRAQPFQLPTANRALYEPDGGEKFFVGTTGRPWTSGMFGCVRSEGFQMHEGLDIQCLQRDKQGEPTDPVLAAAAGTVAYLNPKPSLSNYGHYLVLRHQIEGLEVYTIYGHLRSFRPGLKTGDRVQAGEVIATLGRSTNTREGISKERAHVHFEIDLFANDRFVAWYKATFPGQRNDHGQWNGQNFLGIDPYQILMEQRAKGTAFSLLQFLRAQTELCRVFVRDTHFPFLKRYAPLVQSNARAQQEGVVGYEIALNFNGVPIQLTPRAASEIKGKARFQLLSVNEAEQKRHPCRKLVSNKTGRWELASNGIRLLELLTH
jgi:hypothetical protein